VSDDRLRVLVFDLPPLLRDLVQRALEADADVATTTAGPGELERAVGEARPDAIIMPVDGGHMRAECRRLLEERARIRLLGLGLGDGRSVLYELQPRCTALGEVVPGDLAPVIRRALARANE
jgi:hypothetical protein